MATRLLHELTYDAPVHAVAAMLSDPAFREQVCVTQKAVTHSVSIDGDVSGKKVVIEMEQPTEGVPSFAKKLVGSTTTVRQEEDWTSPTDGLIHITIPGKPGDMVGTAVLEERDGGTVETVDLEIKVKVPLVGGTLEDLVAKLIRSALKAENRAGRQYLAP
jgi:hypothetical protein